MGGVDVQIHVREGKVSGLFLAPPPVTQWIGGWVGPKIGLNHTDFLVIFEVSTAATMKNGVFWDVSRVALVRTDVSEKLSSSFIRVTKIA
jgi:hypothetical protein